MALSASTPGDDAHALLKVDDYVEERLAHFETYIVQKVKKEIAESSGYGGVDPTRDTKGGKPPALPKKAIIMIEAMRAKSDALEHRQAFLEAKVNALVTDFVQSSQSNSHHMNAFAERLSKSIDEQQRHVASVAQASSGHKEDAPSAAQQVALTEAVMREQEESGRRMREFVGVIALMRRDIEKDRKLQQENQAQWYSVMERVVDRVNVMDEDIATILDRLAANEQACGSLSEFCDTQEERISLLEEEVSELREQNARQQFERLFSLIEGTSCQQKNHESAVSQKLLTVSAQIEVLANAMAELQNGARPASSPVVVSRLDNSLRALRSFTVSAMAHHRQEVKRAYYFGVWRSWQVSRAQLRRDTMVLRLFAKQKAQLDEIQQKLGVKKKS